MYLYQKNNHYFAQVADDLKDIAEEELQSLGAAETRQVYRGIYFKAEPGVLYAINFQSRFINRVLAPLIGFGCHSDKFLYKKASEIHWDDFLNAKQTFAVYASVSHSAIKHSKFAALRVKDAIADYFKTSKGERPSVDTKNPDVWLNLHIENNNAVISLDTSGGSLHKRGYRKATVEAPMIETLAAAIIRHSEWDAKTPLYDPFCGSGTLLCEAYFYATHTPSAILHQRFGFERLPDFNPGLWKKIKTSAIQNIRPVSKGLIAGSDISNKAVEPAIKNCAMIDKEGLIEIKQCDVFHLPSLEDRTIVCNPPYGIRIKKEKDLQNFYKNLGDFLKQKCQGSTAYIYFGERKYIKNLGLRTTWKKPLSNGGLDGRLVKVEVF